MRFSFVALVLRRSGKRGQIGTVLRRGSGYHERMAERDTWLSFFRRAVIASCAPGRNWRWMSASLGIGMGFGAIAGLHRLGSEPATITPEVAMTSARAAAVFFVVTWVAVVAIRFGRFLRAHRRSSRGTARN
jgi:hypothetical protein